MLLVVDFVLEDHVFLPHALILFAHNVRVSVVLVQQCIVEKVPDVAMSVRLRKKMACRNKRINGMLYYGMVWYLTYWLAMPFEAHTVHSSCFSLM